MECAGGLPFVYMSLQQSQMNGVIYISPIHLFCTKTGLHRGSSCGNWMAHISPINISTSKHFIHSFSLQFLFPNLSRDRGISVPNKWFSSARRVLSIFECSVFDHQREGRLCLHSKKTSSLVADVLGNRSVCVRSWAAAFLFIGSAFDLNLAIIAYNLFHVYFFSDIFSA